MNPRHYTSYEEAISLMELITGKGNTFSFTYMKLDGTVSYVSKAVLRSRAATGLNAKHRIQFTNVATNEHRSCYIPLLMAVNNKKINLYNERS
ncbi:hypothetical protein ACE939_00885 [Aquimarina sp. W85]|uniref:hypothetical protein n=1 Tax=Aquimarina rhodophyticola TaxID=3342246 RepID=UPI00366E1D72